MPATSKQQQRLFGLALSVKRGETPRSEASKEVLNIVDNMSEKEIEDYAGTKHKGLPNKVKQEEAMLAKLFYEVREIVKEELNESSINENISVLDERPTKRGVIIMLRKGGDTTSAIFKNRKNADKYNRNDKDDLEKLYKLAKKTPFPKAIDESVSINEAEEVEYSSLDSKEQKVIQSLGKVLDVDRTPTAIFKGIHGTIVQFEINKGVGGYRYDIKELKALSRLPIRWIDNDRSSISIGFWYEKYKIKRFTKRK